MVAASYCKDSGHIAPLEQDAGKDDKEHDIGAQHDGGLAWPRDGAGGCALSNRRGPERSDEGAGVRAQEPLADGLDDVADARERCYQAVDDERVGETEPDGQRRPPEEDGQAQAERRPGGEDEEHRARAPGEVGGRRPRHRGVLEQGHDEAADGGDHIAQHDEQPEQDGDGQQLAHKDAEPARPLGQDGCERRPAELAAAKEGGQDEDQRPAQTAQGGHEPVHQVGGQETGEQCCAGEPRTNAPRGRILEDQIRQQVPEQQDEGKPDGPDAANGRALVQLEPFSLEDPAHGAASIPSVSSKNTSSRECVRGRSSLTASPACTRARLTAAALADSVVSRSVPSTMHAAVTSLRPCTTCQALSIGSARTRRLVAPRNSASVPSATSRPCWITPTRSQICSTSPSRWLESRTVRLPWPTLRMRVRISAMPLGSRPLVGSSRISNSGSLSRAAATPSSCFMPCE